jgi:hypothetical protein
MNDNLSYRWGEDSEPKTTGHIVLIAILVAFAAAFHTMSWMIEAWQPLFWCLELTVVLFAVLLAFSKDFKVHRFEASSIGISIVYKFVPYPLARFRIQQQKLAWDAVHSITFTPSDDSDEPSPYRIFIKLAHPLSTGRFGEQWTMELTFDTANQMNESLRQLSKFRPSAFASAPSLRDQLFKDIPFTQVCE